MPTLTKPQTAPRLVTWDDFLKLDDDDRRELLDGRLVEGEVPTLSHEQAVIALGTLLTQWAWERGGGRTLASGYKVRVDEHRGVMPDVQYFRPGNFPGVEDEQGLAHGRPDLAVEVISPGSRRYDSVRKRADYAAIGVPEYWLIDPERRTLIRFVLRGGEYAEAETPSGDQVFRPDGFEGLEIPLGRLWI